MTSVTTEPRSSPWEDWSRSSSDSSRSVGELPVVRSRASARRRKHPQLDLGYRREPSNRRRRGTSMRSLLIVTSFTTVTTLSFLGTGCGAAEAGLGLPDTGAIERDAGGGGVATDGGGVIVM